MRGCWAWRARLGPRRGPRALLACPSGERHDFGLIILGLALRDRGWRVTFLGPDTPIETLAAAADQLAGSPIKAAGKVFA